MPDWLQIIFCTTMLSLQAWILLEIVKLKMTQVAYDIQLKRIVSDIESEKGTRKRLHENFENRLRALEFSHDS